MEWISIEDRLPKERTEILYIDSDRNMYLGTHYSGLWTHGELRGAKNVTHWMPLPLPPVPEKPPLEIEHPPKKWCC
jgi:uncharacterized protein DUF551